MGKIRWLIPPLLGVAAFHLARTSDAAGPSPGSVPAVRQERDPRSPSDFEDVIAGFDRKWAKLETQRANELNSMSVAGLQARVLELKKKIAGFDPETDWDMVGRTEIGVRRAAVQLGKLAKLEALEWIGKEAPELRASVMTGVAEVDPDLALREIIAGKSQSPCFAETLMNLLQREGEKGPAELAQACEAVSWDLDYHLSDDPFGERFSLSPDVDLRPWIESGAALALAQDGVRLGNLFSIWGSTDPGQALEYWEAWPDDRPEGGGFRAAEIFMAGMHSDEDRNRILSAFERLPDSERAKVSTALAELKETHRAWAMQLEARYPELVPVGKGGSE